MPNSLLDLYRQYNAENGLPDDKPDYLVIKDVLGPMADKDPQILEAFPDFAQEYRSIREANSPGTFGGIKNVARSAFDRSRQAFNVIGGEVDAEDVASLERDIQSRPSSVPWEDWQRSQGEEAAKVFLRDPIEITSNIIASGFAGSLPALAGGLGLGAAGTAVGGPVGGIAGAAAGTGAGSLAVEYGNKYLEVLREHGADLTDPESIRGVLEDPEVRTKARNLAFRRGIPVAAFDAASAGLAGKFLKGLTAGATTGQMVRRGGAEALLQGGLGGGGEVAGALAAGERIQPGAVFEEVIGELGPGAVEVGGSALRRSIAEGRAAPAVTPPGTTPPPPPPGNLADPEEAPPPAGGPVRTSVQVYREVEAMTPEQLTARAAELQAKTLRSPLEDTELELILSKVTPEVAETPPAAVPVETVITPGAPPSPVAAAPDVTPPEETAATPAAAAPLKYTIFAPQEFEGRAIPGSIAIERTVNGRGEALSEEERASVPQPPAWMPSGQYSEQQVRDAIEQGPPGPSPSEPSAAVVTPDAPSVSGITAPATSAAAAPTLVVPDQYKVGDMVYDDSWVPAQSIGRVTAITPDGVVTEMKGLIPVDKTYVYKVSPSESLTPPAAAAPAADPNIIEILTAPEGMEVVIARSTDPNQPGFNVVLRDADAKESVGGRLGFPTIEAANTYADSLVKGEAPAPTAAEPAVAPTLEQDVARYTEIQQQWAELLAANTPTNDPRITALWTENEEIKNRYGGMPPVSTPTPDAVQVESPTAVPVQPAPEAGEGVRQEDQGAVEQPPGEVPGAPQSQRLTEPGQEEGVPAQPVPGAVTPVAPVNAPADPLTTEAPAAPSAAPAPTEPPLPTKGIQNSIDRALAAADRILKPGVTAKKEFESAYATLVTHANKLGIEVRKMGTYFNREEYQKAAGEASVAIAQKYGQFPTEAIRAKRDAVLKSDADRKAARKAKREEAKKEEPLPPKEAAPLVEKTPDLPKPSTIAPATAGTAPTPEEKAETKLGEVPGVEPVLIEKGEGTAAYDTVMGVYAAEKHFTLWLAQRGSDSRFPNELGRWHYIGILGQNKEQAMARAFETAKKVGRGDFTGVAFIGQDKFRMPKSLGVHQTLVTQEELSSLDASKRIALGEQRIGFGKNAEVLVKDIWAKDQKWALWAAANMGSGRGAQIATYIKALPEYVMQMDLAKAEVANAMAGDVAQVLKDFQLTGTPQSSGTILIGGNTYEWKDTIKQFGGRFDSESKSWSVAPDKFAEFVAKLRTLPRVAGGQGASLPAHAADPRLGKLRADADGRPDRSGFAEPVTEYIGADTAALLSLGEKIGMPRFVIDEQIEDVARINRAYRQEKPMFLLASQPGSGKTFVLGGAIRELRKSGAKKIVYVTLRKELISQIQADLAQYGIGDVEFITYPEMRKRGGESSDVLIFDEAHAVKNVSSGKEEVQQAEMAKKWIESSKFTLFSTATPFENPVQAAYLESTGIFEDPFKSFEDFALAYGGRIRTFKDSKQLIWKRGPMSDIDSKAAREFLRKEGVFTSRKTHLPAGMVDNRMVKIVADPAAERRYTLFSAAAVENEDSLTGFAIPWIINFQKRLLEASKVQRGIAEADAALKRGRFPIIFVETKAERNIDIPDLIRREEEYSAAVGMALQMKEKPPARKEFGLPPKGIVEVLTTYMNSSGESEIVIPSAEDLVRAHFGDKVAIFTGSVTPKKAQENLDAWRRGEKPVIIATMAKGGTGLSLHDKVGNHPTTQINVNLPWSATQVVQVAQRSARYGLKSAAEMQWIFAENIPFDRMLAARVGGRMADMGSVVQGEKLAGASEIELWDFEDQLFSETKKASDEVAAAPSAPEAVVEQRAAPLPYGAVVEGYPSVDFRDYPDAGPEQWEAAVKRNITEKQVVAGDKEGSRAVTRIAMILQDKDGKIIMSGIVRPQKLAKVGGGTELQPIALQRMGSGKKRVVEVGGDEPVLVRDVVAHGFKPLGIVHFTGEPARIFQQYENLAAYDRAYGATDKTTGTARQAEGVSAPDKLPQDVRKAAAALQSIEQQIDALGIAYEQAKTDEERNGIASKIIELQGLQTEADRTGQSRTGDTDLGNVPELQTQPLRIRRPLAVLEQMAVANQTWRDWYARFQTDLDDFFGQDGRLFQAILGVTSQAARVKSNVGLAIRAYVQFKNGEPFQGFLPDVIKNLNRLREGTEPQGRKIGNYLKATSGDPLAIVVDRHIAQLFFGTDNPSDAQYTKAEQVIRQLSQKLGWPPREVQAALWAANIRRNGNEPSSYDTYLRRLKANGTLDARLAKIRQRRAANQGTRGSGGSALGRGAANDQRAVNLQTAGPVVDQSRFAIDAVRTQQFKAVANRLRRQGANVEVLAREIFQQGLVEEIQRQLDILTRSAETLRGAAKRAIESEIAIRETRMQEVMDAQGATFTPYHIALAVDDVNNASLANLITLLHEAAEAQTMGMTPYMKGLVSKAINESLAEIRQQTQEAAERTGAPVASEQGGTFDILAENLAQRLADEGIAEGPQLAQAIWRFVKDLYFRAAMALQKAFGAEPSHKLALDWFENQLRRKVAGDFDYRLNSLVSRFLPETMLEQARRFPYKGDTPGGISDYYNGATGKLDQPSALPDSVEAVKWNIAFQTIPPQRLNGENIPGPEARARVEAAAQRQYVAKLEAVRVASGVDIAWADWWKSIGVGEDPRIILAEMEQNDPSLATAAIDGPRMTQVMKGLAHVKVRALLEKLEAKTTGQNAESTEQIETEVNRVSLLAKETNRLESDRRNAELQTSKFDKEMKKLVEDFTKDMSAGYVAAEQYGALSEAVMNAEDLMEGETIPDEYQRVFKAVLDGSVRIFDYVKAIAKLDLDLPSMTPAEVGKAITDNADGNAELKKLAENKPLLVALSTLAVKQAAQFDEVALGWIESAEEYRAIHDELQKIRTATGEQLRALIQNVKEQVKTAGLRERMKKAYVSKRRELQLARNRVMMAQARVDVTAAALAPLHAAVEEAQQSGSEAPSEWFPISGARFIEKRKTDDGWSSRTRTLQQRADGTWVDGDKLRKALSLNHAWLKENILKAGSREYELVKRQTQELGMIDLQAQYRNAHARMFDTFFSPLAAQALSLGGGMERASQMLQRFQTIRFQNSQEVAVNAHEWSYAWKKLADLIGTKDVGLMRDQIYDPISYFLNTEPGLDEDQAIREATRMAKKRLTSPAPEGFEAAVEALLRSSKKGFETLVRIATESGAYVEDKRLKSGLRKALAQGWLTSMRSIDGGLVARITRDMESAGWKLHIEYKKDTQGNITNKRHATKAATFKDLTAEDTADTETLDAALQPLFTPGIIRDWLLPFIRKGGKEIFKYGKEAIPQLALQNAWAASGNNVLQWIDNVGAAIELPEPEETESGPTNPLADFRLSMLKQMDGLFGMEARLAYQTQETRNMFDPMGPKPHVMMDARTDDRLPHEHINFALLDPHTSQMLLSEIAFHGAFGRNGERMKQTIAESKDRADKAKVDYDALRGSTRGNRVAEAVARGWKDFKELENLAARSKDILRWQENLESFMSVGQQGGPFEQARAGMWLLNFMAGQVVDNPKTAFYNLLSLAQTPFAQHSLGPRTLRGVSDAFVNTAKTGLGSILEALHLHILHASQTERWITEAIGASRNQPWLQAVADIGPGGAQTLGDKILVKPLNFIRYVQNKGVGLPLQGAAQEFPRAAPIPGMGVANSIAQIAAVGGMTAQVEMVERMITRGIEYFAAHRDAAQDSTFRFKAADVGMGRFDKGAFDWWRVKLVDYGLGQIEDMVRASMPASAKGEGLLSRDQVLKIAQMTSTEINGDSSINTTPGAVIANPWLRAVFPLLRWPLWAMHKTHEGLRNAAGERDVKSVAKGLAILAAWNLPIGLAFTFLIDEYDDEVTGKKSNLPKVGGMAALPFVGPAAEAIMSDRSIPDTVKAYFVRAARAGNIYGLGADMAAQIAAPTDATSGRRVFSLDQRVFVMSQYLNAQQAITNAMAQGTANWQSVWSPLIRSAGGNAALHVLDVANKVLGLDNEQARNVHRINAGNWIRTAATELQIPLAPGGSGTPTPMSVRTREMMSAAMANDRVGFSEAYHLAVEAAMKTVSSDPSVPITQRRIEAERRVLAGWRGRNPLGILARQPTPMEVRRMLGIMDPDGAREVQEALRRFQSFTRLIAPTQAETQMRAQLRSATRVPSAPNFLRSVPTY